MVGRRYASLWRLRAFLVDYTWQMWVMFGAAFAMVVASTCIPLVMGAVGGDHDLSRVLAVGFEFAAEREMRDAARWDDALDRVARFEPLEAIPQPHAAPEQIGTTTMPNFPAPMISAPIP